MNKNPTIKPEPIEELEKHQSKRKKHKTVCKDKRRMPFTCGICGSENILNQGVRYCDSCGVEKEFLTDRLWVFEPPPYLCECHWKHKHSISVTKCMDCGAVETNNCPACKRKTCWTSSNLQHKSCKMCGYTK